MVFHWLKGRVHVTIRKEKSPTRFQESPARTTQRYDPSNQEQVSRTGGPGAIAPIAADASAQTLSNSRSEASYVVIAPRTPERPEQRRKPIPPPKPLPNILVVEPAQSKKEEVIHQDAIELPVTDVRTTTDCPKSILKHRPSTTIYELPVTPERHRSRSRESRRASISTGRSMYSSHYKSGSQAVRSGYHDDSIDTFEVNLNEFPRPSARAKDTKGRPDTSLDGNRVKVFCNDTIRIINSPADRPLPRTPSPFPNHCDHEVSPLTPQSSGPVTPLATERIFTRQQSYEKLRPAINLTCSNKEIQIEEPEVYDEAQHSPEDFYDLRISPIQKHLPDMAWKPRNRMHASPLLRIPDRPGISTLRSGITQDNFHNSNPTRFSLRSNNEPPKAPKFNLQETVPWNGEDQTAAKATEPSFYIPPLQAQDPFELPCLEAANIVPELETRVPQPYASCNTSSVAASETTHQDPRGSASPVFRDTLQVPSTRHRSRSTHSDNPRRRRSHKKTRSEASSPLTGTTSDRRSTRVTTYRYTPTQDSRADRRSYNTVRMLDSGGERHEKLRRVLGI